MSLWVGLRELDCPSSISLHDFYAWSKWAWTGSFLRWLDKIGSFARVFSAVDIGGFWAVLFFCPSSFVGFLRRFVPVCVDFAFVFSAVGVRGFWIVWVLSLCADLVCIVYSHFGDFNCTGAWIVLDGWIALKGSLSLVNYCVSWVELSCVVLSLVPCQVFSHRSSLQWVRAGFGLG